MGRFSSMLSPSDTLCKIIGVMRRECDLDLTEDHFTIGNLGLIYIYRNEEMVITCQNFFESQKQFVSVLTYPDGTSRPYIWYSDYLEDADA